MEFVVIALGVIVGALALATVALRNAQVRFRQRQWAAVQQLSPGAVVFGIYESPVVLTQLNYLRATTVPPLPPLERSGVHWR